MKLTVIGSGDAFNGAGRGHSCYWIEGLAERPLMVDFGATALMGLGRAGMDPLRLGGIAVTHLHGDHVGGLPFLLIDGIFRRPRHEDLALIGPQPLEERLDALHRAHYGDLIDRKRSFEFACREIRAGEETDFLGAGLRAWPAEHMDPPDEALILAFTSSRGKRIVFTGDSAMTKDLLDAARGADLLVAECSGLAHPAGRHCTWEDWLEVLPGLDAGQVLLSHLSAELRAALPRLKSEIPPGVRLRFADDLETLRIP